MIKELIKLATHLDERGLAKEADYLDTVIKRASLGVDNETIHTLTRNTGDNYIEQFEGALANILGDLVPGLSQEDLTYVLRNSGEHQRTLKSLVDRSYSVEGAGKEFLTNMVNMMERFRDEEGRNAPHDLDNREKQTAEEYVAEMGEGDHQDEFFMQNYER